MKTMPGRLLDVNNYLAHFDHARTLSNPQLCAEIDRVWDSYGLDNRKKVSEQQIGPFYSHPVWILNGLFAEADPVSLGHRRAISNFIFNHSDDPLREIHIADFGGGSGVLAEVISRYCSNVAAIDIVEPWPFDYFTARHAGNGKIRYVDDFVTDGYDFVIAEDVLEHVEDPIQVALRCINAARVNGYLIFANCFYPAIKCHLPQTFYLRHTFRYVITSHALVFEGVVPGANHAQVFIKTAGVDEEAIRGRAHLAQRLGPLLNRAGEIKAQLGRVLRDLGLRH